MSFFQSSFQNLTFLGEKKERGLLQAIQIPGNAAGMALHLTGLNAPAYLPDQKVFVFYPHLKVQVCLDFWMLKIAFIHMLKHVVFCAAILT
jgi:hypothetical protein